MDLLSFQLLDNMESKMKGTCVEGTIPKLFEGKMLVSNVESLYIFFVQYLGYVESCVLVGWPWSLIKRFYYFPFLS